MYSGRSAARPSVYSCMRHTIQAWTLANPSRRAPGAKLRAAVRRSPKEANQLLQRFPGIGEPGADKILLFAGGQVSLGPDSNALRVLYRLGFGKQEKDYGRTYRSAAEAVRPELPRNFRWLIRAHQLLRRHGQEICQRAAPRCEACPLTASCRWFKEHGGRSGVAEQ